MIFAFEGLNKAPEVTCKFCKNINNTNILSKRKKRYINFNNSIILVSTGLESTRPVTHWTGFHWAGLDWTGLTELDWT